ncbi:hypothetical protein A6779_12055 [Marinobacter adhaerens]|uniref:HD domain-containing protein n=1 Tax=Marinobacter adhaerens TaxID=1033846 RepID=UPI000840D31E|nr:hypothetical protein [Marinobacter adhaerens]ODM29853.1 hypothetical protein A6779_12055 [Marinobacter adhaerens]
MQLSKSNLLPIELWLQKKAEDPNLFPNSSDNHFDRYWTAKTQLEPLYKWIGPGTSAEDNGIYTDHSIDHFNAVIKYTGFLLGLPQHVDQSNIDVELKLNPYEVYLTLVSILLHDAGNIYGRQGHEKRPAKIIQDLGPAAFPDNFEARTIAHIARVHGGKKLDAKGETTKDTISNSPLKAIDHYKGTKYRAQLIAAIVRFADEICEDRDRASQPLLISRNLPRQSEVFHQYAHSISSVEVDLQAKMINIKFELEKEDAIRTFGKGEADDIQEVYIIDEINERLEKMYCELCYCRRFFAEALSIDAIRATVIIHDEDEPAQEETFELRERGYPSQPFKFKEEHPEWCGEKVKNSLMQLEG